MLAVFMRITLFPAAELTAQHVAAWSDLQRAQPGLSSPYFRPEFTQAVARVRDDVEVALLEADGRPAGFFPFQRSRGGIGLPVGGRMSDFHGVVAEKDLVWDCPALLHDCRLAAWHFDHLPADQKSFQPYHWSTADSPYMDLSGGWDGYEAGQLCGHKNSFKRMMRKARQVARDVGDIRFEFHYPDPQLFDTLIQWKRRQYQATGVADVLALPWTVELLRQILVEQSEGFAGVFSVLYVAEKPAALLLSMKSHDILHAWFSVYGPDFIPFSPGLILWFELAKAAEHHGIRRIDLGKGPEEYKIHLMSGAIPVAEGSVDRRPMRRILRRSWRHAYEWLRNSSLKKPLIIPGRFVRRLMEMKKLRS
jgi:CelD/BcsL family acetyltransferase involved in cellulose biosynthesis